MYFDSGGWYGAAFWPAALTGAFLLALGLVLYRLSEMRLVIPRRSEPYRLVNVVVLLRSAQRFALPLELLVLRTDFSLPAERARALSQLAELIAVEDIVSGFYDVAGESWAPRLLGRRARRLFREQCGLAGVDLQVVNIRGERRGREATSGLDGPDGPFVLGLAASVQGLVDFPSERRLATEIAGLLGALAAREPGEDSWLGLWFAPLYGESMSKEEGEARFDAVLASTV